MMRSILAATTAAMLLFGLSSGALAQRDAVDRADRGQRLDSDAFRNDMLQRQQRLPASPAMQQPAPAPEPKKKKSSKSGTKPNQ